MKFISFSEYLNKLEETSSRLAITDILASLFKKLDKNEVKNASYLLIGSLAPSYEGVVFNVAEKMMMRAIAMCFDKEISEIQTLSKKQGDLGTVAQSLANKSTKHDLNIDNVYNLLRKVSDEGGEGSQEKRVSLISELLTSLDPLSVRFVVRMILGKLRLGFSEKTMIEALSVSEIGSKGKSKEILRAYEVVPDIGLICERVKTLGIEKSTKDISPIVGIPVAPMLCQRLKTTSEMIKKMKEVSVEPKFDGLRVLIHFSKEKKTLKAFTRNLNDISNMFPELTQIEKHLNVGEVILDSEAVGMDPDLIQIADFQTTMTRRRKHNIEDLKTQVPLRFQVFDILYVDGFNLMDKPYLERRERLKKVVKSGNLLVVDESTTTTDPEKIKELHNKYRNQGLEGIIAKRIDGAYVPGRVGWNWVKMKETEEQTGKLSDTVDAIIMGFSYGKGKRADFGVGQFLVGVLDKDQIKTISKVGTGLTDEQFRELNTKLQSIKVSDKPTEYEVNKALFPDVWVNPKIVVELAADDITVSPNHTAGYAMRFPRLVRFRDDKSVKQATTLKEFKNLFELQKN